MKKYLFLLSALFMIALSSTSCNRDEDNSTVPAEETRIIGKWEVEEININGESQNLNTCTTRSTVEFFPDGTVHFTFLSGTGDCTVETSVEEWEYLGNNTFKFTEVEDGEEYEAQIGFSNSNNYISIIEENTDGLIIINYRRI